MVRDPTIIKQTIGFTVSVEKTYQKNHCFYSIHPKKYSKSIGFTVSFRKSIKKHGFYSIRPKKYSKSIGFTVSVRKSIEKALVLQYPSEQVLKKHWFYSVRQPKSLKQHWFYKKTSPSNQATGQPSSKPPKLGLNYTYSATAKNYQKALVLQYPSEIVSKKQWFCSIRPKKN